MCLTFSESPEICTCIHTWPNILKDSQDVDKLKEELQICISMSDFTPKTPIALQIRKIIFEKFNDVDSKFLQMMQFLKF